ncbi:MAG: hypothetical protein JWP88_1252 [Flaviaesturariibacter sp.]|nr:hypothetical protein [Flaviaesturariibacter sp.]
MLLAAVMIRLIIAFFFLAIAQAATAQYKLQGTVYDSSHTYPLESVTVLSTSGKGAVSNNTGVYVIEVSDKDSVWFSYLGKPTIKFPVKKITDLTQFDIALRVPVTTMKEIKLRPRDYRQDSIQNRIDYARAFDFRRPNLGTMTSMGPMGAGIDIDELIRVFQFRKNRSMMAFQKRLLQQEEDKYIDHRFNKALVRRLTELTNEDLDRFMLVYRPTYAFALGTNDYDFQAYIKQCLVQYKSAKAF